MCRKRECATQPRSPLRMSAYNGRTWSLSQLMTDNILFTISLLDTWISSHEWSSSQLTHNVEKLTQLQEEESQLGGNVSCRAKTWRHHAEATRFRPFPLWFMIPRYLFLWWGEPHGAAEPWSCWPSSAHVEQSLWSPSTGAAPTPSEWVSECMEQFTREAATFCCCCFVVCDLIDQVN